MNVLFLLGGRTVVIQAVGAKMAPVMCAKERALIYKPEDLGSGPISAPN